MAKIKVETAQKAGWSKHKIQHIFINTYNLLLTLKNVIMKKLFLLLAMVGMAFASCTPGGNEPNNGGNGNGNGEPQGAADFEISATNITESNVTVKITPKQEGRTFYWNIVPEAKLKEFATTKAYMEDYYDYLKTEAIDTGYYTWEDLLDNAPVEYEYKKCNPSTKYAVWAFGIDLNGNLTSADLSYVVFETKASTFDPTTWYGYWNVTAPKHVSIGDDPFTGDAVTEFVDEELSKVVAITDASEDAGAGYVYVWGWDGVFEMEMPMLGLISGNKIKIANNTVLFTENDENYGPMDYGWYGMSYLEDYGDWYTIGGSYDCYTFTHTGSNAATVTAYQGQLTDGSAFMTDYCCFAGVITTGQNKGAMLTYIRTDGQPALWLSGESMTAEFLAPLEEVAAQKLNANKKFKHYTMMATPKAASKFSSAVNFAK